MANIANLQTNEFFLISIIGGIFFLILGISFYTFYIKPKKERKRKEQEIKLVKKQKKEIDERIKKNQKLWKEVADYIDFIERENKN